MTDEKRLTLKAISVLLQYPDDGLAGYLDSVDEVMRECFRNGAMEKLAPVMDYFRKTPLLKLREEYTHTFDFDPKMCLNITYHRWGDERERGNALAQLDQIYRNSGYETMTSELPDYLPLMLEFFSVSSPSDCCGILEEYGPQIEALGSRLGKVQSPYAALFEILCDTLEPKERGRGLHPVPIHG